MCTAASEMCQAERGVSLLGIARHDAIDDGCTGMLCTRVIQLSDVVIDLHEISCETDRETVAVEGRKHLIALQGHRCLDVAVLRGVWCMKLLHGSKHLSGCKIHTSTFEKPLPCSLGSHGGIQELPAQHQGSMLSQEFRRGRETHQ